MKEKEKFRGTREKTREISKKALTSQKRDNKVKGISFKNMNQVQKMRCRSRRVHTELEKVKDISKDLIKFVGEILAIPACFILFASLGLFLEAIFS